MGKLRCLWVGKEGLVQPTRSGMEMEANVREAVVEFRLNVSKGRRYGNLTGTKAITATSML